MNCLGLCTCTIWKSSPSPLQGHMDQADIDSATQGTQNHSRTENATLGTKKRMSFHSTLAKCRHRKEFSQGEHRGPGLLLVSEFQVNVSQNAEWSLWIRKSLPRHPQAPTPTLLSSPLWKVKVLATQLCLTLCNTMDCSPPSSSVHGILQARILERVAMPSSWGSSRSEIEPRSPALQAGSLPSEPPGKSSSLSSGFYYCSPFFSFLPFILFSFIKLSFYFVQCARHQYYYPQRLFSKKLLLLLEGWTNRQAVLGSITIGWHLRREAKREGRREEGRDGAQPVWKVPMKATQWG